MKKKALLALAAVAGLGCSSLFAQTVVRQVDADTLLVQLKYGKPPHSRMLVERDADPAVFAAFDEIRTQPTRNPFGAFFAGAPGKSHYPQAARRFDDLPTRERTEFAQFEESSDAKPRIQRWHGAPGKGPALK